MPQFLSMYYESIVGPGIATYHSPPAATVIPLAEGESSESKAREAAEALSAALGGLSIPESLPPRPFPAPPDSDPILQLYLDRAGPYAGPAQRVIARWAAFNHLQLEAQRDGWTQEAIAGLLATPRCQSVVAALTTFGWGLAASLLAAATTEDHPLATPDVIEAYLTAMGAEGCLPQ